jgi:hypothetical protein
MMRRESGNEIIQIASLGVEMVLTKLIVVGRL